ncbi:MAG: proteasome subunit beta [Candidatus Brockarchaeota archaeon]|nr:proteasome subunit beta [Candidatus Brockarchaeota archaeon]
MNSGERWLVNMGEYVPGATVVGLVYRDGVILGADRRAAYGTFIIGKSVKKIFRITPKIGLASAGLISDVQTIVRELNYYARMFQYNTSREITAKALSKLLSNILFANRLYPLITQTIIGGFTFNTHGIYALDALGSVIEDKYAAAGSGTEVALGILEAEYRDGLSRDDAKQLVLKAIRTALQRDSASGNGIDLLILDKAGPSEENYPG